MPNLHPAIPATLPILLPSQNLLLQRQSREQLARAIDQLAQREHLVLTLYYHEELTTQEIGAVLGISDLEVLCLHEMAMNQLGGSPVAL